VRAVLLLAVALVVTIGVGVAVEAANPPAMPAALSLAIDRTLGVQSVEMGPTAIGAVVPGGVAIYQAPALYERDASTPLGAFRLVISGSEQYEVYSGPTEGGRPLPAGRVVHLVAPPSSDVLASYTFAQQSMFPTLIFARTATRFSREGNRYSFALSNTKVGPTSILGGTLTVADGFVRDASLELRTNRHHVDELFRYGAFDSAPTIRIPGR
jgi:hypothetical protein